MWRGITGNGSHDAAAPMSASSHGRASAAGGAGVGAGRGDDASGGDSWGREGLGRLLQGGMIFVGEQAGGSDGGGARPFSRHGVGGSCGEGARRAGVFVLPVVRTVGKLTNRH